MKLGLLVTGGIAASLIPGWILYLRSQLGWKVVPAVSQAASAFVAVSALEAISGNKVLHGNEWITSGQPVHKTFSTDLDAVAICPASFNICGKLGAGIADDLLTTIAAFSSVPVVVFPAFSDVDVGKRRDVVINRLKEMDYIVSEQLFDAFEVATGEMKERQGFPHIQNFVHIMEEVVSHAGKTPAS